MTCTEAMAANTTIATYPNARFKGISLLNFYLDTVFSYGSGTVTHISFERALSFPLESIEVIT
jgi:hypothetical protein